MTPEPTEIVNGLWAEGTCAMGSAYESVGIQIETTGALAGGVKRAAGDPCAAHWARWSADLSIQPPSGGHTRAMAWRLLTRAPLVPVGPDMERELRRRFAARAPAAAQIIHRVQIAALLSGNGVPARIDGDLAREKMFAVDEAAWLFESARRDLKDLWEDLARIYPEGADLDDSPMLVSWTGEGRPRPRMVWIGDCSPSSEWFEPDAPTADFARDDGALARLARRLFGVETFRPGQAEAAATLLSHRDLSLAMPTGAGKSLAFHLAGCLIPGTALIVAPLRALLRDQARRLREAGAGRVGLMAGDEPEATAQALADLEAGKLRYALAAPERLDMASFRIALRGAAETAGVSFIVVDEAHCAARRGHDWRPAYRALGARLRTWASCSGREPALAAVSAGASTAAGAEAERVLALSNPVRIRAGLPRDNLAFHIWTSPHADHAACLRELLTRRIPNGRFGPGIVFFPRVDGPLGAATLAEEMVLSEGIDAAAYTGRPPAGVELEKWSEGKRRAADDFLAGRRGLLFATRAFGMGVDRSDVRFVIHLGFPASLEEYLQQAGRAGRDGLPAVCWIVAQILSERRARRWAGLSLETLRSEIHSLSMDERDDVSRAYAFHLASFPGEESENRDAELALFAIGDLEAARIKDVALPGEDEEAFTRALLRLEEVGVIQLRERLSCGWRVKVVGGRSAAWTLSAIKDRVARDYQAVEPARRSSLAELVERALGAPVPRVGGSPVHL